jgi:hypothetical protein
MLLESMLQPSGACSQLGWVHASGWEVPSGPKSLTLITAWVLSYLDGGGMHAEQPHLIALRPTAWAYPVIPNRLGHLVYVSAQSTRF